MKILNVIFAYASMLILGAMLFVLCRPYAMAHRADPSLYGGEVLLIFVPSIIMLFIMAGRK